MIVFIAGMPRSGSTFSFNIVRCLLEARGTVYQDASPDVFGAVQRTEGANHILLKAHSADETTLRLAKLGAIKVVCTVRKPEDAVASWMTTFGFTLAESLGAIEGWLQMFREVRNHALVVPFEDIESDPGSAAWTIARYVCEDADELEVAQIAAGYTKASVKLLSEQVEMRKGDIEDIGFSFYDRKTFFHRKHVRSVDPVAAADRIGAEHATAVRQALSHWCDSEGNVL